MNSQNNKLSLDVARPIQLGWDGTENAQPESSTRLVRHSIRTLLGQLLDKYLKVPAKTGSHGIETPIAPSASLLSNSGQVRDFSHLSIVSSLNSMQKKPHLFLCYAHADSDMVHQDLELLRQAKCDFWIDLVIRPGLPWRMEIAEAISSACGVIVYISPNFFRSAYCVKELNYALDEEKEIIVVYLAKPELPNWFKLAFNSQQAIHRYTLPKRKYLESLRVAAHALQDCRAANSPKQIILPV